MKALTRFAVAISIVTASFSFLLPEASGAEGGVRVGVLSCDSVPGSRVDLIVHSKVDVVCVFSTPQGVEHYSGETGIGIGFDLNWTRRERIVFAVLMASSDVRIGSHALAGRYFGGKVSATVGLGAGVAILAGGGDKNVSLQPIAVEISSGLGVAAGLSYLILSPA